MSLAGSALATVGVAAVAGSAAGFLVPRGLRVWLASGATLVAGLAAVVAALSVLAGRGDVHVDWPEVLPLSGFRLDLDPLGAWFVLVVAVVVVPVAIYAFGYCEHDLAGRSVQGMFPLFVGALVFVPTAGSVSTFLLFWELMAVTSLALVAAEHRARPAVTSATMWYGAMTQLGFVAILAAFGLVVATAGGQSFVALRAGVPDMSATRAAVVFVLAVIGFGSKAGIVPLHVWLPRAHPEAPSHASALMSGAMVSLGIYGLVRVGVDFLGAGPRWWGVVLLGLGIVSALFGVLHAMVATDLKVLLAYSTTENMGLVLVGVGAALLLRSEHEPVLAGVALAAALLFVLNHALFKALLFLSAGSVVRATGTRDLDRLGGLSRRLPATTALFAVGALAIMALPPLNGFVSEWALLQVLVRAGGREPAVLGLAMPVAVAAVALVAGLAAATFVKALGTGLLARPRSPEAQDAVESPRSMIVGMGLLATACAALGAFPAMAASGLGRATRAAGGIGNPFGRGVARLQLVGGAAVMSPVFLAAALLIGAALVAGVARVLSVSRARRRAETWGCGRVLQTSRMEYTASSFAEPLQRVFDDVLHPDHDIDVTHAAESRWYVDAIRYRSGVVDAIDQRVYRPLVRLTRAAGERARGLQNGSVHRYLAYGLVALLVVLVVAR
ncbi:MAG: proton-conducting transporter membrane subunit [Acidimicrobiia bacterium]|nr:proton-conducting transporter membrane subunit [Acidimicrobiia bacterium]